MIQKLITIVLLAAGLLVLSGCNTMRGLGADFEALGESIQDSAD